MQEKFHLNIDSFLSYDDWVNDLAFLRNNNNYTSYILQNKTEHSIVNL